MEHPANMLK